MYRFSTNGVSVVATLDTRRAKKDGTYPIKIQVVHCRRQVYYSTYSSLTKSDWQKILKSKNISLSEIRHNVERKFTIIKNAVLEIVNNDNFSFILLNSYLGKYSTKTINEAFKIKINDMYKNGQINSFYNYRSAIHALERFAGKSILFIDITPEWLKRCEQFWMDDGLTYSSMSFYFRDLKSVFNTAIKDGVISRTRYPFGVGKYEIPKGAARKLALGIEEIKLIFEYTSTSEEFEMYRDLWIFSYLCNGINFKDMIFLKKTDIINNEICFIRDKTANSTKHSRLIHAAILPEMSKIISRWGAGVNSDYIFSFANGRETEIDKIRLVRRIISNCNKVLGVIGKEIGVNGKITTYSARHSFATILKINGVNVSYISECLGHSSIKITETYLDSFDFNERLKNSRLLTNFKQKYKKDTCK